MVLAASRMHLDGKLQLIGSGGKGGLKGNRYSDTPSFKRTDIQREYSFSCLPNATISIFFTCFLDPKHLSGFKLEPKTPL